MEVTLGHIVLLRVDGVDASREEDTLGECPNIPLPWQEASGLTMKVFALPFWNYCLKSPYSLGKSQVLG